MLLHYPGELVEDLSVRCLVSEVVWELLEEVLHHPAQDNPPLPMQVASPDVPCPVVCLPRRLEDQENVLILVNVLIL